MQEKILKSRARLLKDDDKCTLEFSIKLPKQLAARLVEKPSKEDTTPKPVEDDDDLDEDTTPKPVEDDDDDWEDKPSQADREGFQASCRPSKKKVAETLTEMMDEKFTGVIVIGRVEPGPVTTSFVGLSPRQAVRHLKDAIDLMLEYEDYYK